MKKTTLGGKQKKTLELKIETVRDLRTLDPRELAAVAGGRSGVPSVSRSGDPNCTG